MRKFLHHLFLPRESNNFRSALLHYKVILLVIFLLLITKFTFVSVSKEQPEILGITTNISVDELLQLTNQKRTENGLPALTLDQSLTNAATAKASDMLTKNYWAHNAPDGTPPWSFIKSSGYHYFYAGENLARGFTSTSDVVNAWMESPGHRDNLLSNNYSDIGFAIVSGSLGGEDTVLIVQMFGSKSQPALAAAVAKPTITVSPTPVPALDVVVQVLPTPTVSEEVPNKQQNSFAVASIRSSPRINVDKTSKGIGSTVLLLFIGALSLDVIVIKRKNIFRIVSHNADHIVFLIVVFVAILMLGKGVIL